MNGTAMYAANTHADVRIPDRGIHPPQTDMLPGDGASLIRIGRVASAQQAILAGQALSKVGRCWRRRVEAYRVHGRDRGPGALPPLAACRAVAADAFAPLLDWHLRAGRLFVPTASGASPELALYALASGVPLEAICFDRISTSHNADDAPCPLHGDLFLSVGAPTV